LKTVVKTPETKSLVSGLKCNPNSILWLHCKWNIFILERNQSPLSSLETEVLNQTVEDRLKLHQGKSRSDAVTRSDAEGHVSVWVNILAIFFAESIGIESFWIGEILRIVVEAPNGNKEIDIFREVQSFSIIFEVKILRAASIGNLMKRDAT
jgi:hypothetical protein